MSEPGQQADQPQGQTDQHDDKADLRKIARWVAEIELYDRETSRWRNQAKRIIRRYKDDRGDGNDSIAYGARFNAFWANVQTQMPSLYARNPKPDIQRRFKDADPVGRVASDVLERCVSYFVDTDDFYSTNRRTVKDYKLVGRGTTWERYVPHMAPAEELTDTVGDGNDADVPEVITFEEVITDYVHMKDFGHNICRTPDEIWCGWRLVYMTRPALVKRFGKELGNKITLDYVQKDLAGEKLTDGVNKASIYELWDKERKVAVWFHKSIPDALDLREDPLKLERFFPFPTPLLANLANDSCIPTPDYIESQDQYIELDDLTTRIAALTKAVKAAGVYDASAEGLNRLLNEGVENKLIPIENFAVMAEKGGLANAIFFLPLKDIVGALTSLYQARDKVKQDLHEISGIPDIARGSSDANETLGAQELKTSFAINRISDDQRDIQRFVREQVRLKVDIICGHFQLETIKKISGVRLFTAEEKAQIKQYQQAMQMAQQAPQPGQPPQPQMQPPEPPPALNGLSQDQISTMMTDPTWEEVDALIRDDTMRSFRIDIETDSTIKADEQQQKQDATEFVTAMTSLLKDGFEAAQQDPDSLPLVGQIIQFATRRFSVGKEFESTLSSYIQKKEKEAQNPQPKPNPEMMKIQADAQLGQQKMQQELELAQKKAQLDAQVAQAQQQAQAAQAQQQNQLEAEREQRKLESESQLEREKMSNEMQLEMAKAHLDQQTKIEVARITAKATDGAEEEATATEAVKSDVEDEDMQNTREIMGKLDALIQHLTQPQQAAQPDNSMSQAINNLADAHRQSSQMTADTLNRHSEAIGNLHKAVSSEKEIVRDPKTGKPTGVRIKQDPKELGKSLMN